MAVSITDLVKIVTEVIGRYLTSNSVNQAHFKLRYSLLYSEPPKTGEMSTEEMSSGMQLQDHSLVQHHFDLAVL